MKRLYIGILLSLFALFTLQAQESEPNIPRILGFDCSGNSIDEPNGVTSLELIGCPSLYSLNCSYNQLTGLDVQNCRALTSLNASGCTALTRLNCYSYLNGGKLSSLDVSNCASLTGLVCNGNQLTSLDVSGCTALTRLACVGNQLTSLDVSGLTSLKMLLCDNNQLTSLDVSGCTVLTSLKCSYNQLTSLDLSDCTALELRNFIYFPNIRQVSLNDDRSFDLSTLPGMDVTKIRAVGGGHIEGNILYFDADEVCYIYSVGNGWEMSFGLQVPRGGENRDTLRFTWPASGGTSRRFGFSGEGRFLVDWGDGSEPDTVGYPYFFRESIEYHTYKESKDYTVLVYGMEATDRLRGFFSWYEDQLTSLDPSGCPVLTSLSCNSNQLSSLDVSRNPLLTSLSCNNNQLSSLDVSRNPALMSLDCKDNRLTGLDVSRNPALTSLSCNNNQLSSLDVSRNPALTSLDCSNNQLLSLDVSACTSLTTLNCSGNFRHVTLNAGRSLDLSSLPGMDVTKVRAVRGGHIEGNILYFDADVVSYGYDIGGGREEFFQLLAPRSGAGRDFLRLTYNRPNIPGTKRVVFYTSGGRFLWGSAAQPDTLMLVGGREYYITISYGYSETLLLRGLDDTAYLTYLDCRSGYVTDLVCNCPALTTLYCSSDENKNLESLDVSGCTALRSLDVSGCTALRNLDVSGCTALDSLDCRNLWISLDVSGCTALTYLYCHSNELDVSGCTALTYLNCGSGRLTSLDVSSCTSLTYLDCRKNQLTSLDVSGCTALDSLDCRGNKLTSLDVSGCTSLTYLNCAKYYYSGYHYNELTSLDVSGCKSLTYLDCSDNKLTSLDVSGCKSLTYLDCATNTDRNTNRDRRNKLTSLDVSGCTALTYLDCRANQLTSLDVSGFTSLTYLNCCSNQLTSLDVSGCTALNILKCATDYELRDSGNKLTNLDVSGCTALEELDCRANQLTSLNVSGCTSLTYLYCGNGDSYIYSYDSYGDNKLTSLDVSGCTALTYLDCRANQLTSLNVSGCTFLTDLYCGNIYVYDYNYYNGHYCGGNKLTSLDVSGCTALERLDCDDNQLTGIDVSGCTALERLDCDNNQLTGLDVSRNTALGNLYCRYNRIPLSGLYETYRGIPSSDVELYIRGQSDSLVLLVGEAFDLTSERRIGDGFSTYKIKDRMGNVLPADLWQEQGFVFRFNEDYTYILEIQNPSVSDISDDYFDSDYDDVEDVTFTWHITVLESLADYLTVQVAANHAEWGRVSVAGNGRFKAGATATVTATPNAGYRFVSWTKKDGTVLSTSAAYTFTVTENVELTANFAEAERHTVLLSAKPSGWGEVYQSGGGLYAEGERVTIIATAKTGYHFINWTRKDGTVFATEATHTFTVTEDLELTANFGEQRPETHTVVLSVNNEAYGSVSQTGGGTYEQGTEATITATAHEGYRFINWTRKDGTVFTTEATHTFTVTEDIELTANFEKRAEEADTYTVLLSANNNDYGRVSQTGDGTYEAGEEVTITATAKAGYGFVSWTRKDGTVFNTQAVHTFAVTENLELTANFEEEEPETYTVVLSANPPAWGSVYQTGGGIYEAGSQATVIAMANDGYRFVNWTEKDGGVFATEAAHTFMVTEDVALTANFEKLPDAGNGGMEADNLYVYVKDHTIYLSEERGMVRVYNAAGVCVYSGRATAIPVHSGGLYIVRVGERAYKAVVR